MDSFLSLDAPEALFTSGAKMAPKNPSAALFERNLRSIKRHIGTHLHARLTKIHETQNLQSRVVGTPANGPVQGTLNIDLGRVRLYSTNAEDYAAGQVGAFLTKPYRFILPIIAPEKFQMPRLHDMALSIDEWVTQAGLTELRYKDAGHLVSVGLGLG